jgi:anthranilate/para-aminobenzoate synthase component II
MIVMIDNYDSFTYNLVQYLGELGAEVRVYRNDATSVEEIRALKPSHIVISPGPGGPSEAGISRQVIRELGRPGGASGTPDARQDFAHLSL